MLKMKSIMVLIITLFMLIIITSSSFAATVGDVKYSDSEITVSGTCTTSDQVSVVIFDSNKQPIYFGTVKVEDGVYNSVLPASFDLKEGETYTVKIADYSGLGVSEKTFVAVGTAGQNEKDETPKTGI